MLHFLSSDNLLKPFYFFPWPSHLPTNWQTSLGLSHFLTTVTPSNSSLHLHITIPPFHPLIPTPWPSHLSIKWHSFLIPFTPPWWLSHFLSSDAPPQALLLLPMTITPPHQLTNLLLHFLTTVTPSTPPYTSHITITPLCQLSDFSNTFHTSLRTVTLPVICHTFLVAILHPLLCSATVTLHWQLSPFPNGTHTFFTALILHVHFSHFPDNLTAL